MKNINDQLSNLISKRYQFSWSQNVISYMESSIEYTTLTRNHAKFNTILSDNVFLEEDGSLGCHLSDNNLNINLHSNKQIDRLGISKQTR